MGCNLFYEYLLVLFDFVFVGGVMGFYIFVRFVLVLQLCCLYDCFLARSFPKWGHCEVLVLGWGAHFYIFFKVFLKIQKDCCFTLGACLRLYVIEILSSLLAKLHVNRVYMICCFVWCEFQFSITNLISCEILCLHAHLTINACV